MGKNRDDTSNEISLFGFVLSGIIGLICNLDSSGSLSLSLSLSVSVLSRLASLRGTLRFQASDKHPAIAVRFSENERVDCRHNEARGSALIKLHQDIKDFIAF